MSGFRLLSSLVRRVFGTVAGRGERPSPGEPPDEKSYVREPIPRGPRRRTSSIALEEPRDDEPPDAVSRSAARP